MTALDMEYAMRGNIELDEKQLDLVSGGERTLFENIHRLLFAVGCVHNADSQGRSVAVSLTLS